MRSGRPLNAACRFVSSGLRRRWRRERVARLRPVHREYQDSIVSGISTADLDLSEARLHPFDQMANYREEFGGKRFIDVVDIPQARLPNFPFVRVETEPRR